MLSITHNTFCNELFVGYPVFSEEFAKYPRLITYAAVLEQEFSSYLASRPQKDG